MWPGPVINSLFCCSFVQLKGETRSTETPSPVSFTGGASIVACQGPRHGFNPHNVFLWAPFCSFPLFSTTYTHFPPLTVTCPVWGSPSPCYSNYTPWRSPLNHHPSLFFNDPCRLSFVINDLHERCISPQSSTSPFSVGFFSPFTWSNHQRHRTALNAISCNRFMTICHCNDPQLLLRLLLLYGPACTSISISISTSSCPSTKRNGLEDTFCVRTRHHNETTSSP